MIGRFIRKVTIKGLALKIAILCLCGLMLVQSCGCSKNPPPSSGNGSEDTSTAPPDDEGSTPSVPDDTGKKPSEEKKSPYPAARREPIMCENITLNAYYVPMWNEEVRENVLGLCKDADIDVLSNVLPEEVLNNKWNIELHTYEWYKDAMAAADRYGLKIQTRETALFSSLDLKDSEIVALAKKYRDLPGFGGFFVVDEPRNPSPYARVENLLRRICPDTRVNVNFLPVNCYSSPEDYLRQLCDYGGLLEYGGSLSLDCYNFPGEGGVDEKNLFTNYEMLRQAGLKTNCNTAVYVQSVGMVGGFNYRRPSEADLRYNMMAALAYGVKEIKFFTFGSPGTQDFTYTNAILDKNNEPTELYYSLCTINKKVHAIGAHLAACDARKVYHSIESTANVYELIPEGLFVQAPASDVILSLMEERAGSGEYVMVVNKDIMNPQTVTLTFDGIGKVFLVDEKTGELVEKALDGGALTLELLAGDSALIKLPEGDFIKDNVEKSENLAHGASVYGTYSLGEGGFYLYNLTDGITSGAGGVRVHSNGGKDQYLTVDLGDTFSINRIDLYPSGEGKNCGKYNPKSFTLLTSEDGENWTEVVANVNEMSATEPSTFRFDSVNARFVRIRIIGLKGSARAELAELEVYNEK